jgi:hypothetical protein
MSTIYEGKRILKKRIRGIENHPYGMIVALNENQLGWSMCNESAGDRYSDDIALLKAIKRAECNIITDLEFWVRYFDRIRDKIIGYKEMSEMSNLAVNEIQFELTLMQDRASKYFKNEK